MSVTDEREFVELPNSGDAAFGALLDALVPAEASATGGAAAPAGGEAAAVPVGGAAPAAADGAAPAAVGDGAPAGGQSDPAGQADPGKPDAAAGTGQPAGEPADGGAGQPAADGEGAADVPGWTADPAVAVVELGKLSTTLEENLTKGFQQQAYEQAREDYEKYFEALEKHPRLLVGAQVPAIGKEGMEVLRNSEDAKEWQEAVRSLLVEEIRTNAQAKMEESSDFLETIHASIDLFKNNKDLIPGAKGFNKTLADQFAAMAQPYEVRVEGKLQGYSIPVQPIIDNLRKQLAAKPAAPPAPPAAAPVTRPTLEPPQAGIPSKAGSSAEREDFSTLFGTIGLPNLQI